MRKRQLQHELRTLDPVPAAILLRSLIETDRIDEADAYEALTERVIEYFRRRMTGEALSEASRSWLRAIQNGTWTFETAPALGAYLARIKASSFSKANTHRFRHIDKYMQPDEPTARISGIAVYIPEMNVEDVAIGDIDADEQKLVHADLIADSTSISNPGTVSTTLRETGCDRELHLRRRRPHPHQ